MLFKRISILIIMALVWLFFATTLIHAQSLTELNTTQTQTENEKSQEPVPLNMEHVQQMVQQASPLDAISPDSSQYTLGVNDIVDIAVMRHPEVSGQFPINAEGKIQYNFVGDVTLSGFKKDEAAKVIADRLAEYIISPEVTVKIVGYNSKVVFVVGEVAAPGKIFMRGDTITIRDALVQAGLPTLSGVTDKSWLITPAENGKAQKKHVNVYALLYEGDLRQNFIMKPGDVLYIPPSFLTKTMRAISPVTTPVGNVAGTARTVAPF